MQKAPSQELILLGEKIKKIREKKLMSQSTLASMCDVDIRTIQRIEKGEYGFGVPLLFAIANALDRKVEGLVKNISSKKTKPI